MRQLSLLELNRSYLSRQSLLERQALTIPEAIQKLLGLQSQIPNPPYIGLWTRLQNFQRQDLTNLMESRQIVRAAFFRSTLHLMTANDHQAFQGTIQPALSKALAAFFGQRAKGLDIPKIIEAAKPFLAEMPRSTGEIRAFLLGLFPDADGDALAYALRNNLPLVQVPPSGTWGSGSRATYTQAEQWLGKANPQSLDQLFRRYLAAFGPASIMDFQTWVGMTNLKNSLNLDGLSIYKNEDDKDLFDLAEMPILAENTPAPIRFIPEYDNVLIGHADRRRILADEDYKKVFLSAARVSSTILVDGFVAGTWKTESKKKTAKLLISPFKPLASEAKAALIEEGKKLLAFIEAEANEYSVEFLV